MTRARLAAAAALTFLATVLAVLPAPAASAAPQKKLDATLAALWTAVLQTPSAQNSFGTGAPRSTAGTWVARSRRSIPSGRSRAP